MCVSRDRLVYIELYAMLLRELTGCYTVIHSTETIRSRLASIPKTSEGSLRRVAEPHSAYWKTVQVEMLARGAAISVSLGRLYCSIRPAVSR